MTAGIIRLDGLAFRGFHGVYPEEQKTGNDFLVDVELHVDITSAAASDQLADTVDYAYAYDLIRRIMEQRRNLLESLASRIADELVSEFKSVQKVCVTVSKLRPAIGGDCTRTSVTTCRIRT